MKHIHILKVVDCMSGSWCSLLLAILDLLNIMHVEQQSIIALLLSVCLQAKDQHLSAHVSYDFLYTRQHSEKYYYVLCGTPLDDGQGLEEEDTIS